MNLADQIIRAWDIASAMSDTVIIAGGCLRDLHAGVQAKDIDVFINQPFQTSLKDGWVVGGLSENDDLEKYTDSNPALPGGDVNCLLSIVRQDASTSDPDDLPIQVIVNQKMVTAAELIARFDFGVCQIASTNGRNRIYTRQFQHDFSERKLTYLRDYSSFRPQTRKNAWTRARRFQQKLDFDIVLKTMPLHPDWEFTFNDHVDLFSVPF